MRELIHFAHGNGFPSPCYHQLLTRLNQYHDCCYIDRIGHNPEFPVTENWHFLIDEVIASIKLQATKPVIAVGHSLGGVLSLLASIEQPSLFKAVIMLDSPLISRFKSKLLHLAKAIGLVDRVTPASRTRHRRQYWQNKNELLRYLKTRELFKHFTEECLQDYIDYGLKKTKEGYLLRFDSEIEYAIYRTIPHTILHYEGRLARPAVVLYGDKSTVITQRDLKYMKKYHQIVSYQVSGSHMFPMEYPEQAAKKILSVIEQFKELT